MKLEKARALATYLTDVRKINHVIIKSGNEYAYCEQRFYSGTPVEIIRYENTEENKPVAKAGKGKNKAEKEQKEVSNIQDLRDSSGEEILQGNGE